MGGESGKVTTELIPRSALEICGGSGFFCRPSSDPGLFPLLDRDLGWFGWILLQKETRAYCRPSSAHQNL
ncbi:hypothetical protein ACFX15_035356 [Malus domestica]